LEEVELALGFPTPTLYAFGINGPFGKKKERKIRKERNEF